jgi:rRNA maturation endonuclease Nob1
MSKDRNPRRAKNWQIVCRLCGKVFAEQKTVGEVQIVHFRKAHGSENVRFELKWVGIGPAPVSGLN